jgi:hypothetical protein
VALRSSSTAVAPGASGFVDLLRERRETLGYVVVALGLGALLIARVLHLDGFFLDEWLYVHGAEYMWDRLPLGPFEQIPNWTRGPQRLYTVLLVATWGPFTPAVAYVLSHVVNVVLLVSAIWPAALLARRVIDEPGMRVMAVALAVAVPWLLISAHLLTENLAFPLFLWTVWAIVAAAERPGWWPQLGALGCIAALTLCRLNLAVMFVVLVVAVLCAEIGRWRSSAEGVFPLRQALRRRLPTAVAVAVGLLAVAAIARDGGSRFGAYGGFANSSILDAVWGSTADESGRAMLTYVRSLATGSFVFPLVLGLGAALAGARGRIGARFVMPGVVALASFVGVLAVVAVWTGSAALEERYAFYVYAPLAILAVASIRHLPRLLPDLTVAGAVVVLALAEGTVFAGSNGGNFFTAPAGAFWTRVVDHRLRAVEDDVLGVLPGAGDGWMLIAAGVAALLVAALLSRRDARVRSMVAVGLALCALAQVTVLQYDYDKLLYGTPEAPGGLALSDDRSLDREEWIDDALPDGARAAIVPALATAQFPYGDAERQQFWNKSLDASVALRFAFVPTSIPPGFQTVLAALRDGLATWDGPSFEWVVAQPGDPRVQYGGTMVARSRSAPFGLFKLEQPPTAVWTGQGVDTDGAVLAGRETVMTLNRAVGEDVRAVTLELRAPAELSGDVRWTVERSGGGRVASGTLAPGGERSVRLNTSRCGAECATNDVWRLVTAGATAPLQPPFVGAPPPPRPVRLFLSSAMLAR